MSPFHQIDVLHHGRIVLLRRSPVSFPSVAELQQERQLLVGALNKLGRAGRGLLVDSRQAPHGTEERMRDEFCRFRHDVARGFVAVATLVRTKVGMLQVRRLGYEQCSEVQAFDDESAAISYLLGQRRSAAPPAVRGR